MVAIFGAQWLNAYGDEPPAVWRTALGELTTEQIGDGLRYYALEATSSRAFVPTLPEFRFRCLGVPEIEQAVIEALKGGTVHPFVERLRSTVSTWDQRHLSAAALTARYRAAYAKALRELVHENATPESPARIDTVAAETLGVDGTGG